jgi:hypothetical protein
MMAISRPTADGELRVSSRSYFAGGSIVMTESDEHRTGRLDTVTIYQNEAVNQEEI